MSSYVDTPGVLEKPTCLRLTAATITDVLTATDQFQTVIGVILTNETGGAVNLLLDWYDGTTDNHIWKKPVPANDSVVLDQPIRLLTGNKIKATAGSGNAITVTLITKRAMRQADEQYK